MIIYASHENNSYEIKSIFVNNNISDLKTIDKYKSLKYIGEGNKNSSYRWFKKERNLTWGPLKDEKHMEGLIHSIANFEMTITKISGPMKIVVASVDHDHEMYKDSLIKPIENMLATLALPIENIQINLEIGKCSDVAYLAEQIKYELIEYIIAYANEFVLINK